MLILKKRNSKKNQIKKLKSKIQHKQKNVIKNVSSFQQNKVNDYYNFDNFSGLCDDHNIPQNIICTDPSCKKLICYKCGLFGEHKKHKLLQKEEFDTKFAKMVEKIKKSKRDLETEKDEIIGKSWEREVEKLVKAK